MRVLSPSEACVRPEMFPCARLSNAVFVIDMFLLICDSMRRSGGEKPGLCAAAVAHGSAGARLPIKSGAVVRIHSPKGEARAAQRTPAHNT